MDHDMLYMTRWRKFVVISSLTVIMAGYQNCTGYKSNSASLNINEQTIEIIVGKAFGIDPLPEGIRPQAEPVRVNSVTPSFGPPEGGTSIVIKGQNFRPEAKIIFAFVSSMGSLDFIVLTDITYVSTSEFKALTPKLTVGPVVVIVANSFENYGYLSNGFTYRYSLPTPTPAPTVTPTATPKPSPTATPTPPPGPCNWGKDVEGQCLPQPPSLSCAPRLDDPPGLMREGFGCDAKGGSGTGIIKVTALGPDGAIGTLRWAYDQINAQNRRVVCDSSLQGDIILNSKIYWNKPYSTLDFSACNVTVKPSKAGQEGILVGATHNVIVYSVRVKGYFMGSDPNWIPPNNAGLLTLDGDSSPIQYSWDDLWVSTPPTLRRGVRSSIFDRNSLSGCEDDCLALWEGVRDVSITRNSIQGFHPSTNGAKGAPIPQYRERLRNFYGYNLWYLSGERQTKPREEAYHWVYARNFVWHWTEYTYKDWNTGKPATNWPGGLNISDDYQDENTWGWIMGACFVGTPGTPHEKWGISVGNNFGCEGGQINCPGSPGTDYTCCNPKMANTHWYFEANEGMATEGRTNPIGWVPPALPFSPNKTKPWIQVLGEVGVVKRSSTEQAQIDQIIPDIPKCKVVN